MSDENLRVTERLTRTGPNTITYRATAVYPTVYTRPGALPDACTGQLGSALVLRGPGALLHPTAARRFSNGVQVDVP
jgi:hypothetical protein